MVAGLVGQGGAGYGGGVAGVGQVGWQVGRYGPVAVNVYSALKGVCSGT